MKKFAKLFEVDNHQVLVVRGRENDEDQPVLEFVAHFENAGQIVFGITYISEEGFNQALEETNEDTARWAFSEILEMRERLFA